MTEVGSLTGGESFSTEASSCKALSSQTVGGEINAMYRFSLQGDNTETRGKKRGGRGSGVARH